ncbi:MAG: J domain-containing protein [Defluviitaleaceae bacterium]|nr:J domain-containing protein [Defluviitaleaceae bacterium]
MRQTDARAVLKTKLRNLKKTERCIRKADELGYVWDFFFTEKYPAEKLLGMDADGYRAVVDEYFFYVYLQLYKENGFVTGRTYDGEMLARFGLPYDADEHAVKKKFRELAKLYHPDAGGDGGEFAKLLNDFEAMGGR